MRVARRYKFRASHFLPGVAGYDHEHEHDYTVEVVATAQDLDDDGMVVDTAALDDVWELCRGDHEDRNLNQVYSVPTTVENIATVLWEIFLDRVPSIPLSVTVWEDDDRWGQAP